MKGILIGDIDASATLIKHINTWEVLEKKRLSPQDWVSELVSQVYSLSKICLQQQQQIDTLILERRKENELRRRSEGMGRTKN